MEPVSVRSNLYEKYEWIMDVIDNLGSRVPPRAIQAFEVIFNLLWITAVIFYIFIVLREVYRQIEAPEVDVNESTNILNFANAFPISKLEKKHHDAHKSEDYNNVIYCQEDENVQDDCHFYESENNTEFNHINYSELFIDKNSKKTELDIIRDLKVLNKIFNLTTYEEFAQDSNEHKLEKHVNTSFQQQSKDNELVTSEHMNSSLGRVIDKNISCPGLSMQANEIHARKKSRRKESSDYLLMCKHRAQENAQLNKRECGCNTSIENLKIHQLQKHDHFSKFRKYNCSKELIGNQSKIGLREEKSLIRNNSMYGFKNEKFKQQNQSNDYMLSGLKSYANQIISSNGCMGNYSSNENVTYSTKFSKRSHCVVKQKLRDEKHNFSAENKNDHHRNSNSGTCLGLTHFKKNKTFYTNQFNRSRVKNIKAKLQPGKIYELGTQNKLTAISKVYNFDIPKGITQFGFEDILTLPNKLGEAKEVVLKQPQSPIQEEKHNFIIGNKKLDKEYNSNKRYEFSDEKIKETLQNEKKCIEIIIVNNEFILNLILQEGEIEIELNKQRGNTFSLLQKMLSMQNTGKISEYLEEVKKLKSQYNKQMKFDKQLPLEKLTKFLTLQAEELLKSTTFFSGSSEHMKIKMPIKDSTKELKEGIEKIKELYKTDIRKPNQMEEKARSLSGDILHFAEYLFAMSPKDLEQIASGQTTERILKEPFEWLVPYQISSYTFKDTDDFSELRQNLTNDIPGTLHHSGFVSYQYSDDLPKYNSSRPTGHHTNITTILHQLQDKRNISSTKSNSNIIQHGNRQSQIENFQRDHSVLQESQKKHKNDKMRYGTFENKTFKADPIDYFKSDHTDSDKSHIFPPTHDGDIEILFVYDTFIMNVTLDGDDVYLDINKYDTNINEIHKQFLAENIPDYLQEIIKLKKRNYTMKSFGKNLPLKESIENFHSETEKFLKNKNQQPITSNKIKRKLQLKEVSKELPEEIQNILKFHKTSSSTSDYIKGKREHITKEVTKIMNIANSLFDLSSGDLEKLLSTKLASF